jgi:hypothetical protein
VLGTFQTYPEAQAIVNRLAKAEFPVDQVAIVGNDLKTVERVTGRLTYGRAAAAGAASGAWFGLFFGFLLVLFSPDSNLLLIGAAALIGAGFGMLFGLATYAVNRRRQDFTSLTQVVSSSYQVIVNPRLTARAQTAMGGDAATEQPFVG